MHWKCEFTQFNERWIKYLLILHLCRCLFLFFFLALVVAIVIRCNNIYVYSTVATSSLPSCLWHIMNISPGIWFTANIIIHIVSSVVLLPHRWQQKIGLAAKRSSGAFLYSNQFNTYTFIPRKTKEEEKNWFRSFFLVSPFPPTTIMIYVDFLFISFYFITNLYLISDDIDHLLIYKI